MSEHFVKPGTVTIDTGFFDRSFCVLCRMERGVTFLRLSVAGHAINIRGIHQTGRLGNADPSPSLIEILRSHMHLLAVAPVAKGGRMCQGGDLSDFVTQGGMTVGTFDLVVGDMFPMENLRSILRAEKDGLVMALETFSLRNVPIALDHADVAFLAGHPSFDVLSMIETPIFDLDVPLRLKVARGTASDGTGQAILFSLRTRFVVMADEARGLMNRQVLPLNELGVAGRASQRHPPSKFAQVFSVREGDVLVDHVPLEIRLSVAPFLQATRIAYLRMGRVRFFPGDEVSQGDLSVHPFTLQVVKEAGLVMTLGAGDLPMARSLPGRDIGVHLMAGATKSGGLRKFQEPDDKDHEDDAAEKEEDLNSFLV